MMMITNSISISSILFDMSISILLLDPVLDHGLGPFREALPQPLIEPLEVAAVAVDVHRIQKLQTGAPTAHVVVLRLQAHTYLIKDTITITITINS